MLETGIKIINDAVDYYNSVDEFVNYSLLDMNKINFLYEKMELSLIAVGMEE